MGTETPIKLPLIDFSKIYTNQSTPDEWDSIKTQVHQALSEYGFFRASMAGMSPEFRDSLFSSLEQLFDLPLETKRKSVSDKPFDAYWRRSQTTAIYESMAIPNAQVAGEVESFTDFFWAHGNPEFSKSMRSISDKLCWLDRMVRKIITESLGVEKYLDDHMDNMNYNLRLTKYKGLATDESITGLASHIDKTSLSILYQNEVEGFELKTKSGEWIRVEQSPDSFGVVVGEVFHAWLNGRLHPPYHRVMMNGNEARYSLGLLSVPKPGYITRIPDELVDEEHPLLFNPFDYDELLKQLYTRDTSVNGEARGFLATQRNPN